ncbi:mitochondrial small ribosomal subunit Rsm22-domain-containing protein [Lophiotrema nucula]|uniref:Mitochondrial small ribosomal subunit Rsm22-domain-containing protein n=1 Tax=Lophiotrema nucula TaxID=690887 RepID=A0A6A5YRF3_9PLEO|nr:mitochondrial small ribosomal subunit Rsm22-domain-containing protein [Lophiotrema nucula]
MLTARRLPSVCISCRLNILASQARNASSATTARTARASIHARDQILSFRAASLAQRRSLSTTFPRREQEELHATSTPHSSEEVPVTGASELDAEVRARQARQLFGDALPRDHLSEREYTVYERLYGTPVFVDNVEELGSEDVEGEELVEEELPDGSTVLLRTGEDGELEEVAVVEEVEAVEEVEKDDGVEEDETSMTEEEWDFLREEKAQSYHQSIYEKSAPVEEDLAEEEEEEDEDFMRAHPLTRAGRFAPSPSTVFLPKESFVDSVSFLLTRANHRHLAESANRIFGGKGLPQSATTAAASLQREQKPIPLDPSHGSMGQIEGDVYMAAVMPGTYASVMSTLVEVRRRLGTPWIEHLLQKKGGPVVLDAGSGGAGIIAWHEVLKAEWQRLHEESEATSQGSVPLGKATVLAGSDVLRHRASRILEDTTFIPRLPDEVTAEDQSNTQQPRKLYDLIIAPHTLWPLKQEYLRKEQVEKYWSLLNPNGGVLILLEKGLPRGFEVIAAARQLLLDKHIASPDSTEIEVPLEEQTSKPDEDTRFALKETGMIIAPCTNHSTCPMYQSPGISQGRKDFCFFKQRYIRPPYLQRILNAKDRNHEDIQFSYIAVQRGRDQRLPAHDLLGKGVLQNESATEAAFAGHEWKLDAEEGEAELRTPADVNPLAFPRLILPAIKRRGHIILDVCTPAGTLERWTVPRSFSKQAFRDARKARWGDLWALGAKTRIPRSVRLGRPRDEFDQKGRRVKAPKQQVVDVKMGDTGFEGMSARQDGRYSQDRKIRGSGGRKGRKKKAYDILQDG